MYTLWANPQIVPLLHTPDVVLKKLQGGADLMTPGLQRGPPFPVNAKKDSIVAVASLENPSVPLVVGICKIDVSSLQQVQGVKGHAVEGVHWSGDEVWAWSQAGQLGLDAPDSIEAWDPDGFSQDLPGLSLEDNKHNTHQESADFNESRAHSSSHNGSLNGEEIECLEEETEEKSTKGTPTMYESCFSFPNPPRGWKFSLDSLINPQHVRKLSSSTAILSYYFDFW